MNIYKRNKDIFDFLTFIFVVIGLLSTFIFRSCDKQSAKPKFDFKYDLKYVNVIDENILWDFDEFIESSDSFNNIYTNNLNQIPDFIYNSFFINITITDKSSSFSAIKKIEIKNISIDNPDFNIKTKQLPVFIVNNEYRSLDRTTIINFLDGKTKSINLLISIPMIFSDSDYNRINSYKENQKKIDQKKWSFHNENLVLKHKGETILINKDFYENVVLNSVFNFDLVFYDQNNKVHKLKNILLKDRKSLKKIKLTGKSIVG